MSKYKVVQVNEKVKVSNNLPFTLIAGPCQMESRDHALMMAEELVKITDKLHIPYIFKASFDKANRTSIKGARGMGLDAALPVFAEIKKQFGCATLTDIHWPEQCEPVAKVVDALQIPALLSRQTDLILAAGKTGKTINVKKGQFIAPWDIQNIVDKLESVQCEKILLTERGTAFGYNRNIVDPLSLPIMAQTGYPVVIDAGHAIQQPSGKGSSSAGHREFIPVMARAAIATTIGAVFIETHDDPDHALSDGPNSMRLDQMEEMLKVLQEIDAIAKEHPVDV